MCQERVGANLMFALELITLSFLCTMGEHKVRPYTFLAHKEYSENNFPIIDIVRFEVVVL